MPNRLADSTSPYLLQHAGNPVDWYPWGDEAAAAAAESDRPMLLSVGYSSCHWCHVMAHESFEDPETALLMNRLFINVKVDREERPDVDSIYMEAVQSMTGHGGWPMTVFLTPAGEPFFAGTYFPKEERHGMPAFRRVLAAVSDAWETKRDDMVGQAAQLTAALGRSLEPAPELPTADDLATAYRSIEASVDPIHGGFGSAPKFPQQPVLDYLLRIAGEQWAPRAAEIVRHALIAIAAGGIYDQVGGGFARYSVDREWRIPHFEKMLYDNAQLARLYAWAARDLEVGAFRRIAIETLEYLERDLRHPEGGFYSAEDADSEGEEGRFYAWSEAEFREIAGDDAEVAAAVLGVTAGGNFEGANHLYRARDAESVADEHGIDATDVRAAVDRVLAALRSRRSGRVRPDLDDKVISSWNGLAIRAFAEAGAALGEPRFVDSAEGAARFVLDRLVVDGDLRRTWSKGRASDVGGFLEDHAALGIGLLALYATTGDPRWYDTAAEFGERIATEFVTEDGGFAATAVGSERLIVRPRDLTDNPAPSGTATAAELFLRLSQYSGEGRFRDLAERAILAAGAVSARYPHAAGHTLAVAHSFVRGPLEAAVAGDDAWALAAPIWDRYRPHVAVAVATDPRAEERVPLLTGRFIPDRTLAYVCRNFACDLPTDDPGAFSEQLGGVGLPAVE